MKGGYTHTHTHRGDTYGSFFFRVECAERKTYGIGSRCFGNRSINETLCIIHFAGRVITAGAPKIRVLYRRIFKGEVENRGKRRAGG